MASACVRGLHEGSGSKETAALLPSASCARAAVVRSALTFGYLKRYIVLGIVNLGAGWARGAPPGKFVLNKMLFAR